MLALISTDELEDAEQMLFNHLKNRYTDLNKFQRFVAISADPGILGCGLSHESVLANWKGSEDRLLLVCEDDAQFLGSRDDIDAVLEDFYRNPALSVLALANNTAWNIPITERLAISSDIQTTACYAVKENIVQALLYAARRSSARLRNGEHSSLAAIDIVWKEIQRTKLFAVPRQRLVVQLPGYSDVQREQTDYGV
jgi:GR25 family glycosyltransferase involved in LPS biosynthesis